MKRSVSIYFTINLPVRQKSKIEFHSFEFLCPQNGIWEYLVFVLSVTLWQKNFNLGHNFGTVRDRDFIFGMHIQLMKPF